MKACLVVPYYGPLPRWLPLFFQSVANNPGIDLMFVTSERLDTAVPSNVRVVALPLDEIERRVRERISPEFRLRWAYKLCDLKPFYALLFPELVADYEFWGYCDLDLVFGRLDPVLAPGRLANVDIFTADSSYVTGHFALLRNHPEINGLAARIPGVLSKLNAPEYCSIDENDMQAFLPTMPSVRRGVSSGLHESQTSLSSSGRMIGRTQGVLGHPHEFTWRGGRTLIRSHGRDAQEVMYLHFIGLKRRYHWTAYDPAIEARECSFSAAGFRPWATPPTPVARLGTIIRGTALGGLETVRGAVARSISEKQRRTAKKVLARFGVALAVSCLTP